MRTLFIAEAIVSVLTGLGLLLLPETTLDLYGLESDAVGEFMAQNYGGLYIALGLLAWLVRGVREPALVRTLTSVFALYHLVLLALAAIAWLGDDFDFELGWASVLLEAGFGLAFLWFRLRARDAGARS
jgi:hypothetical protein